MSWVRWVLVIAALACSACGVGDEDASVVRVVEPIAPDGCPAMSEERLDAVVALAIDGLADTSATDVWSRACARALAPDGLGTSHTVTIRIGWMGTLHEFESIAGAYPIVDLADEAYAFDAGRQIALRSGELVAVVSYGGVNAHGTEGWARRVADLLPE